MRETLAFPMVLAIAGCSPGNEPVSVDEVKRNMLIWDGQEVTIDGWLGECQGFNCMIFPTEEAMVFAHQAPVGSDKRSDAFDAGLSIGHGEDFDSKAAPLQFSPVRLRGRIDSNCTINLCLDRASDVHPLNVAAQTKSIESR